MEQDFDKTLETTLFHLHFIATAIENAVASFTAIIDKGEESHERMMYVSIVSNILVQTVAFLDEYNKFFRSSEEHVQQKIIAFKSIYKPAIDQINVWKDIRVFRNQVRAHNLRDTKTGLSVFERGLTSYDIPQNGGDVSILISCISIIKESIALEFKQPLENITKRLSTEPIELRTARFPSLEDFERKINEITAKIKENIGNYNSQE